MGIEGRQENSGKRKILGVPCLGQNRPASPQKPGETLVCLSEKLGTLKPNLMEIMGFERGEYATIMALTAGVSMTVSFSTPFALGIFKPRTLMITSQVLFLAAGITLAVSPSHAVSLFGITLICAGFSVGFGVAMSQALGPFSLRAGVASSTLGIAQVCGSSLWIWLAAVVGIGAWNMLIGILIACSIVSLLLIMFVAPGRPVAAHEEIHHHA